jgi:signal transduction histidine kinase
MSGAVLLADEHQQHQSANRISRAAWASADDVGDPPTGTWLGVVSPAGRPRWTAAAPAGIRDLDPRSLPDGISRLVRDGRELSVYTGNRKIGRVSAAFDLRPGELEERRLLISLGIAALIGVICAAAVGALIGRRAVQPLGAAMALQRRFVADASHELRTPLTVLLTRAQILRRHLQGTIGPLQASEVDRLVHDAKILGDVVNDLLLSAELEHRSQVGEPFDVYAVATDVAESLQPLAAARSVELTVVAAGGAGCVSGAQAALRRALVSLIDNAIAHTPPGGHVRVEMEERDGQLMIAVRDDGEGLVPRQAERLVQRFARDTLNNSGRRFGLGLALVDEIARAHGGALIVEGELGRGAAFTLRLPSAGS